jgi:hypothetical protein
MRKETAVTRLNVAQATLHFKGKIYQAITINDKNYEKVCLVPHVHVET